MCFLIKKDKLWYCHNLKEEKYSFGTYISTGELSSTLTQIVLISCCLYHLQHSCGKVMFLHLSVSHSVHRGCLADTPPRQTPQADSLGQTPPRQTPSGRHPLGRPPGQTPPQRRPLQRTVGILLECILVFFF